MDVLLSISISFNGGETYFDYLMNIKVMYSSEVIAVLVVYNNQILKFRLSDILRGPSMCGWGGWGELDWNWLF